MRFALAALLAAACGSTAAEPAPWMSRVPDAAPLASLSIPGTHDSGAMFEPLAGIAKTQTLTIADQLAAGVRYFDIRCHDDADELLIFHGAIDQNQTFDQVLATMFAFLDANPSETVVMSAKQEADNLHATRSFEDTFATYLDEARARWYLDAALPTLGPVRGKIVLLRRFDALAAPLGIDATDWPDNTTFTSGPATATLRVQDEYMVATPDAKWQRVAAHLDEARAATSPDALYLDYTSGYLSLPNGLPDIPDVATPIDAHLAAYFTANPHGRTGVVAMDMVTADLAAQVIDTNTLAD